MVVTFTERAQKHLKTLYQNSDSEFIKMKVTTKGCSGHMYDLSFVSESDITDLDEKIKLEDSFTVVLDQKSMMWLLGTHVDWTEDKFQAKFDFSNPMIAGTCGCGESFHFENSKFKDQFVPEK